MTRRRHRRTTIHHDDDTSPAPAPSSSSTSVTDAKAKFMASVARGIAVLMERGFSRERATAVLLREMQRNNGEVGSSSSNSAPNDQEMFECMSQYGLGLEGATKALTVSKVVQREMAERKVSMMDAMDLLTSKLATANLVALTVSSAMHTSHDDDEVGLSVQPTRIQPILAQARQQTTATSTSLASKTATATASVSTRKAKSLNKTSNKQKNTSSAGTRKRSAEETKSDKSNNNSTILGTTKDDNKAPARRLRSDSLSEVVEAKFGATGEKPVEEAPVAVVTTRSKRARADDAEASSSTASSVGTMAKRSRTTSSGGL